MLGMVVATKMLNPFIPSRILSQSPKNLANGSTAALTEVVVIPSKSNLTEVVVDGNDGNFSTQVVANNQFVRPGNPQPASLKY